VPRTPSLLEIELRQTRPFQSRVEEAVVGLFRTADVVRRVLGAVVGARGITLQQYNVLRILRGAGREGLPTLEIGERMVEQAPGVTRLLDRLEAKGLVRRERCRTDRRQVLCWLEPAGARLLDELAPPMRDAARRRLAGLDARGLASFITLMEAVRTEAPSQAAQPAVKRRSTGAGASPRRQGENT
jgi:MarR family transcriptional regulator, organic hydroperoxide resistance regulator